MAPYIPPGPLCNRCKYCTIQQRPDHHSRQFKAISITGIVFKAYEYSAMQIADAFVTIIPGHMDFEIKRQALERWNVLLPELLDGPLFRDTEFDLKDVFYVLDDFLFLRGLRTRCCVEWMDECNTALTQTLYGRCEWGEETNRSPTLWIRLVRPTVRKQRSVQTILSTLMHEMCHAILDLRCSCVRCCCPLNKMNGAGFRGHGPSWEKLRRSVERVASSHLEGLSSPISLCHWSEPGLEAERQQVGRMLSGLYKKITQQAS